MDVLQMGIHVRPAENTDNGMGCRYRALSQPTQSCAKSIFQVVSSSQRAMCQVLPANQSTTRARNRGCCCWEFGYDRCQIAGVDRRG